MSRTVTLPVPVKNWLSVPLREVHLLCKFGKPSSSRRRNMTDQQNHITMSILCHQHLRRIHVSFMTVPPLEKESSGSASVYKIFHCLSEDSSFETSSMVENVFFQFSVQLCVANVISFSYNKEPLMRKTELRARENFVNKIISSVDP